MGAVLLTPIALFALFGKKKTEVLVIEFTDEEIDSERDLTDHEIAGAAIFQYKPKNGRALRIENAIERVTHLEVVKDDVEGEEDEDYKKK